MYIYEQQNWPNLHWNNAKTASLLVEARHSQGLLLGRMMDLGFQVRQEASLNSLTEEVVKSSRIEGENLDSHQVRSSLARRLGLDVGAPPPVDRHVEGIVEMMLDATGKPDDPLTQERLFAWHAALFPTGRSGMRRIATGEWRTDASGPMQVVSGPYGREKIHYEAPGHERLAVEMKAFFEWFNEPASIDAVIKSALAHFWFVTIHPFEDGNGRIARAIADMMLARSDRTSQRFYSMSAQIMRERKSYYSVLENCQKGSLDITEWMEWYLSCLKRAIESSEQLLQNVLGKAALWKAHAGEPFNERQRAMLNRLLDGFTGKLTTTKWARLAKCSQDTALRDINELLHKKILIKEEAGGRSTNYKLAP